MFERRDGMVSHTVLPATPETFINKFISINIVANE